MIIAEKGRKFLQPYTAPHRTALPRIAAHMSETKEESRIWKSETFSLFLSLKVYPFALLRNKHSNKDFSINFSTGNSFL